MKKIVEILNIILLVALLFIGCENRKKTAQQKLMEGMPSSELIPIFIIPELTKRDGCEDFNVYPALKINSFMEDEQKESFTIYRIYPIKRPITVRITLLENTCVFKESLSFCSNKQYTSGNGQNGILTQNCIPGNGNIVQGDSGTIKDCEISFDSFLYLVLIFYEKESHNCKYKIEYF
jgi:hypothetical protein